MKKILIACLSVMAAVAANAATANWKVTGGNIYDSSATSTKYSGNIYVMDAGTMAMAALFSAFEANTSMDLATKAVATLQVSSGAVVTTSSANQFSYGEAGSNYSFYIAIVDGDNIYMSNQLNDKAALNPPTAQTLAFQSQQNGSTTFSNVAPASGFQGAGHWSAVPEPTSGLLLLLGMAGLALRRKRA